MTKTKTSWFKRSLALIMAVVMCFGAVSITAFAANTKSATETKDMAEKYTAEIKSLTSAAPLEPVKTAFAKAFGDSVEITVNTDGSKVAKVKNYHMIIRQLFGADYDANVVTVEGATVLSTKQEVVTNGFGSTEQKEITVPAEFTIPLNLDQNNSQTLTITVDFMDIFLGGGNPYPTAVTLTLDMDNAVLDKSELKNLADECREVKLENYTDSSVSQFRTALSNADKVLADNVNYEKANAAYLALADAYASLEEKSADYSSVDAAMAKIPADLTSYTYKSVNALNNAVNAVDRNLKITEQTKVDKMAQDIESAVNSLEIMLVSSEGKYIVPIKSLVSSAPLPPVQAAFSKAFGESVTVTVNADKTKTAHIKNQHMVVDMSMMGLGSFDANVVSIIDADAAADGIQSAAIISTKTEVFSNPNGNLAAAPVQTEITVPDEFEIPLNLDSNNSQKIKITVDFMDYLLGDGNPYPTTVTLTLDMDAAVIDVSDLEALISECEAIPSENYTNESFAALTSAVAEAKSVAAAPETVEKLNAMISELKDVRDCLEYKGADYSAVNAAVAKIPADSSIYTAESWNKVEEAKNAVVNGLDITQQSAVNAYAENLEIAIKGLVIKDADYTLVDQALTSVPSDLSKYTDDSAAKVNAAVAAVRRGLKADEQAKVNAMASAITSAVASLKEKQTEAPKTDDKIDIANLKDGIYEIPVSLWHATEDKASMAASSLNGTARIVVKNGEKTVYIYTKPMTFGNITASLQEMKVQQTDGTWVDAAVETKTADGNPDCFSFTIDELAQYITVKVNPHVAMMGNQDLDARLKFDLSSIKLVSEETDQKPLTPPVEKGVNANSSNNNSVKSPNTGANYSVEYCLFISLFIAAAVTVMIAVKKSRYNAATQK